MFYSHELLGRKTPLGAIWTLAHGRKLSKGKIISINVSEICDDLMQPAVPHSLRLQGILVGGVVMVFSKQQTYLLEDLQEMMRRVRAAASDTAATAAAKPEKGRGKGKGKQGAGGDNQARLEAITMMDIEDLMAPAAHGDEDFMGLLAGGSLSDALASQGAIPVGRRTLPGSELAGDLFVMPSMGGGTTSEGGDTDAQGQRGSKRSRGTRTATASGREQEQEQEQEEEVYGGVDTTHQDWMLQLQDEVFEDLDFDLLGDLPQAPTDDAAGDKSRDQTSSQQHRQAASADTTQAGTAPSAGAAGAGAARGGPASAGDVPHEFDDEMFVMMDDHTQEPLLASEGQQQEEPSQSDHQLERDQPEAGAEQGVRRAKQQRKRKGGTLIMDDLDNLLIRNKVYREWCTDSSPLLNNNATSPLLQGRTSAASLDPFGGAGFAAVPFAGFAGAAAGGAGVPLCSELVALFKGPQEAAAAERNTGAGRKRQPEQPGSPEVNNSTGEGSLPGMLPYAHKMPLDLHQVHMEEEGEGLMMMPDDDLDMVMPPESPPHPGDQEAVSNDEAHDQLGDLPFNGDIEVERMRAAATPGSSDGSLQQLMPGSTAGTKMTSAGHESNLTSEGGSGLAAARARRAAGSEQGGTGTKRRLGSADLGTTDDLDIFFGTGHLADLLPDIEAEHYYDDQQQQQDHEEGPVSEDMDNAAAPGRRTGSIDGSNRSLTPYSSSQFPLLEETEPDQPSQLPQGQAAALSRTTQVALSIFQERLQRASERQAAGAGLNDAAGAAAQQPSVSFFGLIKEGRLSRNQAATLFYQVCVTSTAGFVSATQECAYGDIAIQQGSRQF